MKTERPNLLFVMTDQQRKDTLGCYGSRAVPTPALDALAREGAVFDHFYVNNPVCVPSRCSYLTGRYPQAHRCRDLKRPLDPGEQHLFRILKSAGYRLGLSGKNHALPSGELSLFDDILERGHKKAHVASAASVYGSGCDPTPLEEYPTVQLCRHARSFLRESVRYDQPFALWLSIPDPHTPIQVPEPYCSMVDPKRLPERTEPQLNSNKPTSQQLLQELQGVIRAEEEAIDRFRAVYYGMIALIDEEIGGVLQELETLGLDENTIVVFTSDHGEYLGDHGMVRKSWNFYDCLLNVPFMLRWKSQLSPARISSTMSESVDLLPTLLELMGLEQPEGVQGKSLAPLLRGDTDRHKDVVFAEAGNPGQVSQVRSIQDWNPPGKGPEMAYWTISATQGCMVRTLERKLCRYANGEGELYDLRNDPGETDNLYEREDRKTERLVMLELLNTVLMNNQDPRLSSAGTFKSSPPKQVNNVSKGGAHDE